MINSKNEKGRKVKRMIGAEKQKNAKEIGNE
jgi:hypothetical protein